ncbi:MAG: multidrug effflux MFS transporter, partial [Alphaproteobacteria bacterium]|nr:multidrug effflux MFS transporter [Alphaproteobacteria bacterium]
IGACAGTVIPRAIVRDIFSPQESARVFSHLILVMGVAPILAPLVGNILLAAFGWRSIFAFLALFAVFCLILAWRAVPETKGANPDEKISRVFKKYSKILRDKNFVISALTGGLMMAGLFAFITGSPTVYLDFFAISPHQYGLIFSINSIGFVIASQINAYLLRRMSVAELFPKLLLIPLLTGLFLLSCPENFWLLTAAFFIFICSCGMLFPNATALALANHAAHSGSASALLGTIQFALAALASFTISEIHDGGVTATALVVGSCGILASATSKIGRR